MKINVPTKKAGVFTLFGLGGVSTEFEEGVRDSSEWIGGSSHYDYDEKSRLGVLGLTNKYLFKNDKSYLRSSVSGSAYTYSDLTEFLVPRDDYSTVNADETHFNDYNVSIATTFNHKFNARNRLIEKDLIAFDGRRFQVLSLPSHPKADVCGPLCTEEDFEEKDPATIREIIRSSLDASKQ